MQLVIEPNNGLPIYEQLVRQIKFAVAEGVLLPGQVIPSVRELSKQLAINPNTVARAFQQLQAEQVVHSLRGVGMAICPKAKGHCVSDRRTLLAERLTTAVHEALRSGLEPQQLRDMFETSVTNFQTDRSSSATENTR